MSLCIYKEISPKPGADHFFPNDLQKNDGEQ